MNFKFFLKHVLPWKTILFLALCLWLFKSGYLNIFTVSEVDSPTVIALKTGLLTSLSGSILFLIILTILKPSFAIADNIALAPSNRFPDRESYTFKIVNKSWFFNANDVRIKVTLLTDYASHPTKKKKNYIRTELDVIKPHLSFIPRRLNSQYMEYDPHCEQAGVLKSHEVELEHLLKKGVIELEVIAKHSLSGFTGIKKKKYYHPHCIINGTFEPGDSLIILPLIKKNEVEHEHYQQRYNK